MLLKHNHACMHAHIAHNYDGCGVMKYSMLVCVGYMFFVSTLATVVFVTNKR